MKYLSLLIIIISSSISVHSQSVTVTPVQQHLNYNLNTFPIDNGSMSIRTNTLQIGEVSIEQPRAWAMSNQGKKISLLMNKGTLYLMNLDASGNKIVDHSLEFFDSNDQTLNVYSFDDGRSIIRDNVANFTFFDAVGEIIYSFSNSAQSLDGERESQLSSDRNGRTVVLYNPVIAYGNNTGSRANIIYGEEDSYEVFRDAQREIRQLHVSSEGEFITILAANNSGSQVLLFDRFGNELYQYQTDDDLEGVTLSSDAAFITKFTSGRVQVYDVNSGESMGSTSSRSPILYAAYIPQDEIILALGGSFSGRNITNPTITAVHLGLREIHRNEIDLNLSSLNQDAIQINRRGVGNYHLTGLNKTLNLQTNF